MVTSVIARDGVEIERRHAAPILNFQVLGERCSGTNIARWLIAKNLGINARYFMGWKHGFPNALGVSPHSLVVCVFRDAFDWLSSLHRKPFHSAPHMRDLEFSEFIRQPWQSVVDRPNDLGVGQLKRVRNQPLQLDRHPLTGEVFKNAVQLRNAKTMGFLSYRNRNVNYCFIRYEALMADKTGVMTRLSEVFELPFDGTLIDSDTKWGTGTWKARHSTSAPVSEEDRAFVLDELDLNQEADIGYRY